MDFKFKYIVLFLALAVAICAAYFSVLGLSQLFAGASISVIIMASVLEIGKLVTTTALHNYWNKLARTLKIYLTISVVILMIITSAGIYGFLSNAYQSTANKLELHEGELGILEVKKSTFEKSVTDNQKLIKSKTKRVDQLSNLRNTQETRLDNSNSNRARNSVRNDIKSADNEIQKLNNEIDMLNAKNIVLADSINSYNVKVIELKSNSSVAAEVGPLKYIAQLTGIPMANVVNYLILLLIFVFDPLAVALILITNKIFELEKQEKQDGVKKVDEKKNKVTYKSPGVTVQEVDTNFANEPTEYSDEDEIIEQPVFENILDPIDDKIIEDEEIIEEVKPTVSIPEIKEEPIHEEPQTEVVLENTDKEEEVKEEVKNTEEPISVKNKISLEDIKEVKERNRGFSVNVPEPRRNNLIHRVTNKR